MPPSDSTNDFILQKIDSIETRLESHVSKIEQRLDQIVNLMQAVATLQEKESRNAETIREIKVSLKDSIDKFDKTVTRVHERLDRHDELANADQKEAELKLKALDLKIGDVDKKVSQWINRGIGIWLAMSFLVVIVQTLGGFFINSFKDEYAASKTQIIEVQKRQNEIEQDLSRISNTVRNISSK